MLVLVVGPSGAGKDALLEGARALFAGDRDVFFARRAITRPPDPEGENHIALTDTEFDSLDFALSWRAHGLRYGIPAEALTAAPVVVANVSRAVIADAAARGPVRVIEVTAPPDILAARLAARGRETADDIGRRLARRVEIQANLPVERVMNDGTLADGVARFAALLRRIVTETLGR